MTRSVNVPLVSTATNTPMRRHRLSSAPRRSTAIAPTWKRCSMRWSTSSTSASRCRPIPARTGALGLRLCLCGASPPRFRARPRRDRRQSAPQRHGRNQSSITTARTGETSTPIILSGSARSVTRCQVKLHGVRQDSPPKRPYDLHQPSFSTASNGSIAILTRRSHADADHAAAAQTHHKGRAEAADFPLM